MGAYNEWTDPDYCERSCRRSPSSSKFEQLLSTVPFWVSFAGGLAIGKMLGRSPGSSHPPDGDGPMDEGQNTEGIDIVEIQITHNAEHVPDMETSYNQGAASFKAGPHGTTSGVDGKISKIMLQYPDKSIVQVKVTRERIEMDKTTVATSLIDITNNQYNKPQKRAPPAAQKSGPWGLPGGPETSGGQGDIVQIVVYHNQGGPINGIRTTYEQAGGTLETVTYGCANGDASEIPLDFPNEYLTQVKCTAGPVTGSLPASNPIITSVTFITNKKTVYGPYGVPNGSDLEFASPPTCCLVTAIYGSPAGNHLDIFGAIGFVDREATLRYLLAYYARTASRGPRPVEIEPNEVPTDSEPAKWGPWGLPGGPETSGGQGDIVQIVVYHNQGGPINGIRTTYEQAGGTLETVTYGCANGDASEIPLDFPNEYLTQVKCTAGPVTGSLPASNPIITSVTFITNKKTVYGPYGVPNGSDLEFASPPTCCLVTAIYGSPAGNHLDIFGAIGFVDREATLRYLLAYYARTASRGPRPVEIEPNEVPTDSEPAKWGPWGLPGGPETSGGQGDIVQIVVYHNQGGPINGIRTTYEQAGGTLETVTYGCANGDASEIPLDFPNEYLTQVKCTAGPVTGSLPASNPIITSVTFITNKKTVYGPYGVPNGSDLEFASPPTCCLVTAIYGSPAGNRLDIFGAIGFVDREATLRYLLAYYARTASRGPRPVEIEPNEVPTDSEPAKWGPWGLPGGPETSGGQGDIVQIVVYHNQGGPINGIRTTYEQAGGTLETVTYGCANGDASEIPLDFPNEYLTQVKCTAGPVTGSLPASNPIITSVTFITNKKTVYGPYGVPNGSDLEFASPPTCCLVTAIYGSPAGNRLDIFGAIGFVDREATLRYLLAYYARTAGRGPRPVEIEPNEVSIDSEPVKWGPWGLPGGPESSGGQGDIVQIVVYYNQGGPINGIRTTYEQAGGTLETVTYGCANDDASEIQRLAS